MRDITRREALWLGALGAAGTVVGAWGLVRETGGPGGRGVVGGQPAVATEVLGSSGGQLSVDLTAARRRVQVAGRRAEVLGYHDSLPGPTWRLRAGDQLRVHLVNQLDSPTNLHTHGLLVSPQGRSDNPFVRVDPGGSFDYVIDLPEDHPPGVFWYHPHHHGTVADQVFGGLYGAIVVEDPDVSAVPATRERVLVISDLSLEPSGQVRSVSAMDRMQGREGDLVLVNGQHQPVLSARPGERERWRVVNACSSRYLRLRMQNLDGQAQQGMLLLGIDSGRLSQPRAVDEVLLAPGNRADLLVTTTAGTAALQAAPYDRGGMSGMGRMDAVADRPSGSGAEPVALATLRVTGEAVAALAPVTTQPTSSDLRAASVTQNRDITLGMTMGMGGTSFTINGRPFDPGRTDQTVQMGAVEQWRIRNTTPMDHPFHLHTWPMQIVELNGDPQTEVTWRDVVNVPAQSTVTVRIAFNRHAGRTVHHCHILDHEDAGMMATIEAR